MMTVFAVYLVRVPGYLLVSYVNQAHDEFTSEEFESFIIPHVCHWNEINKVEKVEIRGIFFHFMDFESIIEIIITDDEKRPTKMMSMIGHEFIRKYGIVPEDWKGEFNAFNYYITDIQRILKNSRGRRDPDPRKHM